MVVPFLATIAAADFFTAHDPDAFKALQNPLEFYE
jgi:hypothetical protein